MVRTSMAEASPAPPGIRQAILSSLRQNRLACLGLNGLVVALVVSYYRFPPVAAVWEAVGRLKTTTSFGFSFVSTVVAAVLVPALVQRVLGGALPTGQRRHLLWSALFWGWRGMEIDLFYRVQGQLFGQGNDVKTLAAKLAVDQLVYSAFWAIPCYLFFIRWLELRRWSEVWKSVDRRFWNHTYLSVLFTNWLVWVPTVTLVYSLPAALQFPLFSVVLTFYVLLITVLVKA